MQGPGGVMGDLNRWVSDELHGLLGISESTLVDYVVALAKRSKDEAALLAALRDNDIPIDDRSRAFAVKLMKKCPRADDTRAKEKAAKLKQQEKERQAQAVQILQQNEQYTLVDDDGAEERAAKERMAKLERKEAKKEKKEKKEQKRQLRKKSKWSSDEEEDTTAAKKQKVEDDDADDLEEWELEELQRVRDLQERDEFAARLKKRDDAKTKKMIGEKDMGELDEHGIPVNASEEERKLIFEESRIVSRQAYLEKRENKKMDELVEAIEDEKHLFEGVELTAKEKRDFAIKQRVLDLVKQRNETIDNTPSYVMPESYDDTSRPEARSRRYKVLDNRYDQIDDKVEEKDTDVHEGLQLEAAASRVGRKKEKMERGQEYDLVIDDQVALSCFCCSSLSLPLPLSVCVSFARAVSRSLVQARARVVSLSLVCALSQPRWTSRLISSRTPSHQPR